MNTAKKLSIRLEAVGGDKVRQEFKNIGSDGQKAFQRITQVITPANDNLKILDNTAKAFNNTLKQAASLAGAYLGLRGLTNTFKSIVETNKEFERLSGSLKTVTGSAKAAKEAFTLIEDFATSTPFQLDEIVDSFIRLKAMGLEPSMEALISYGNTASAFGKNILEFVSAVTSATVGEFERLKTFGIKAKVEGELVKFIFQGITTEVGKNAVEIENYLRSIGTINFGGAMAEQMNTMGGTMSNIEDALAKVARTIGENGLNKAIKEVLDQFNNLISGTDGAAKTIGETLASAVTIAGKAFFTLAKYIEPIITLLTVRLFEQYKHSLECNKTGHFGWGKYYVLLNNLSSFTEFFVDINSNKIIKVQKLGAINPVVARGDASSKLEEQQELREKAPSDQLSITGSKAVAFDVGQYFEEVHGWSSLYSSVFNLMIKKYKQLKPYPDTIVVSCTEGTKKGHYVKLINGLLLNVNYSAVAVMQRIRELLDCYGMTPDQCSIYLENNQGKTIKIKLSNGSNEPSFNVFEAADTQKSDATDRYSDLSQKIYTVLCEKYQKGFRLNSHLEKERFKLFFEQIHSEKIPEEISEKLLDQLILKNGIVYNDRVYIAENMLDENTKEDLFAFINQSFENGHNTIYYTALFKEFSDKFLTQSIFDPDILREYLKYQNTGKYYVFKEYLSKDKSVNQSISDEIIQLLVDRSEPFFQDELSAMLPHIDKNKLIKELRSSSEFISNGKEQYFLARNFNITNDEIETVKKLISDLLDASSTHFITAAEVMEFIHKKVPEIFENNGFISELGVRNALASILGDSFSFNSNVISCKDTNLNLNDIFEDFAKNTSSFSLAELKNLASEFSAPIYFDAINKYAIRISKDEFIGKDKIDFNFKEIDHAISLFCQAGYTPIQAVNTFASFPDVGYKWNTFLLESYLQNYSPAFRVFQASACETKSVGAIVKKTSAYTSFDDILVDAVAKSRCQLQKDTILQFLCDYGYIARRTYSSIDNIIERASQKRNSKG